MKKLTSLCAGLALLFAGSAAQAAEFEMSFQSVYPPAQTANIDILVPWAESFAKDSGGKYVVNFFPTSAIVDTLETFHAVKSGMLDIGGGAPNAFPKEGPNTLLIRLPFAAKNALHGTLLAEKLWEEIPEFRQEFEDVGVTLAYWASASYGMYSVKTPITKPEDLKGKRVLVLSPIDVEDVKAFGGVPVFITVSDAYVGLQRGMGEVLYTAVPYAKGLRIMEVAKYATVIPSVTNLMGMVVNRDAYNDAPEELRQMLQDKSGQEFARSIAKTLDQDLLDAEKEFEAAGCKVIHLTDEQLDAFVTAIQPMIESYWTDYYTSVGMTDSAAKIKRVQELSESIPDPYL